MAKEKRNSAPETSVNQGSQPDFAGGKIEVSDPILESRKTLSEIKESFSFYNNIVIGIFLIGFLVLVFTVAGLAFQAWQFKEAYVENISQLKSQEELIKNNIDFQKTLIESQKTQK